jgi:hypothetical protein
MMSFLAWFDNSKRPVADKIAAALAAYAERFQHPANVVLVNAAEDVSGVRAEGFLLATGESQGLVVQRHTFYVGMMG